MGDTLREIGGRVRSRREQLGWSLADVARGAGVTKQQLSRIEKGTSGTREPTLRQLGEALGMPWPWPLEDAEAGPDPLSQEDRGLAGKLRSIPQPVRGTLERLIRELAAEVTSASTPADELAERRQARPVRLVGVAAAREPTASIAYSDRQSDDLEDVPPELVDEGCAVIRVAGSSMEGAGIPDGSELLVCPAELGDYHRGDIVVADTPRGEVVKRYAGQGGSARPKQPTGVIVLESVGEGETIIAPKAEEGVEGIAVQSVVKAVRRPGGQWERLERSRR